MLKIFSLAAKFGGLGSTIRHFITQMNYFNTDPTTNGDHVASSFSAIHLLEFEGDANCSATESVTLFDTSAAASLHGSAGLANLTHSVSFMLRLSSRQIVHVHLEGMLEDARRCTERCGEDM